MTNRLEINWKLDGFVDEQRYYCSETPIDINNLPAPKVILSAEERSYTDTNIETGKTYYVCAGSVKNGVEKLSEIISVKASDNAISILSFTDNLIDKKGRVWTPAITPVFTTDGLQLTGNDIRTDYTPDFDWVSDSYTIEGFVKASDWSSWSVPGLINGIPLLIGRMGQTNDINQWSFGPVSSGKVHFYYFSGGQKLLIASNNTLPTNELVHIAFCKDANNAYISIAGIVTSLALPSSMSLQVVSEGISVGCYNYQRITGICGGLKITKGEALYTANFTPPQRPF